MRVRIGVPECGWPNGLRLTLYNDDGAMLFRKKSEGFDFSDSMVRYWLGEGIPLRFGVSIPRSRNRKWTEEDVTSLEAHIRYDLEFDGYEVNIERMKGVGIPCNEEVFWTILLS